MQTNRTESDVSIKNVPKEVKFKIGSTTATQAPKKAETKNNLPFSFNKIEQDFKQIKFINIFSIKTYSITICILSLKHILLKNKQHNLRKK